MPYSNLLHLSAREKQFNASRVILTSAASAEPTELRMNFPACVLPRVGQEFSCLGISDRVRRSRHY
jgi:hypothetical protein